MDHRQLPHDLDAEMSVLGSVFKDEGCMGIAAKYIVNPDAFYNAECRDLWRVFLDLWDRNHSFESGAIFVLLKDNKAVTDMMIAREFLTAVQDSVPGSAMVEFYAKRVMEMYRRRQIISGTWQIMMDAYDATGPAVEVLNRAESLILKIGDSSGDGEDGMPLNELDFDAGTQQGIKTGNYQLDDIFLGYISGEMILVGARPSNGKTAWALNQVDFIGVVLGKAVGLITIEMKAEAIYRRLICARAGVSYGSLIRQHLTEVERSRMSDAVGELCNAKIYIQGMSSPTVGQIRQTARRMKERRGVEVLFIDYLGMIQAPKAENQTVRIGMVSAAIKAMATELDIPIVALCQLNRGNAKDVRRPRMSDLRDSGNLEQDADVVMLLHREATLHKGDEEWMKNNSEKLDLAELIVEKNRNGGTGVVQMSFVDRFMRFETRIPAGV